MPRRWESAFTGVSEADLLELGDALSAGLLASQDSAQIPLQGLEKGILRQWGPVCSWTPRTLRSSSRMTLVRNRRQSSSSWSKVNVIGHETVSPASASVQFAALAALHFVNRPLRRHHRPALTFTGTSGFLLPSRNARVVLVVAVPTRPSWS